MAVAFPPTVLHTETLKAITIYDAQKFVSKYLKDSEHKPHLHPDARLEPKGVSLSTLGGRKGGVILHQLRRVEAGLRGEVLQPEPGAGHQNSAVGDDNQIPFSQDAALDALIAAANQEMEEEEDSSKTAAGKKRKAEDLEGEWQDPEVMDAEMDGTEDGPLHDHPTAVAEGGKVPALKSAEKLDKEARKKAKKARQKEEKKHKAAAQRDMASAVTTTAAVNGDTKAMDASKGDKHAQKKEKGRKEKGKKEKKKKHHDNS